MDAGAELIEEVRPVLPRVGVILACSGDPFAEDIAGWRPGQMAFWPSRSATWPRFQQAILQHMPRT